MTSLACHMASAFGAICFGYLLARYVGRIERRRVERFRDEAVAELEIKVSRLKTIHEIDLAAARGERSREHEMLRAHGNRLLDHGGLMLRWGDRYLNTSIPEPERAAAIADIKAAMVEAASGQRVVSAVMRRLDD